MSFVDISWQCAVLVRLLAACWITHLAMDHNTHMVSFVETSCQQLKFQNEGHGSRIRDVEIQR